MKDRQRFDLFLTQGNAEIESRREKKAREKKSGDDVWYYFGLVGQIGFAIALPIAAGGIGGAYLDKIFGTTPKATILLLLVGIAMSFIGFFHVVKEVFRKGN